ncbi:unnamed protein product [Caenorhabditis angaria]|uniref:F-box domain-containing protein n=1 Tax=Caenorhabditis angaria TaxID=860376 RepID=A0A9P1MUF6_9PELO|nr:unnamed protein product [Caenorhabditis angaria]
MSRKRKLTEDETSSSPQENDDISWFDIPLEMREMVTNKMDIKTRCKFMQCSKKCEEEVKISERFLANIKICRSNNPEIHIGLGRSYICHYCLEFMDVSNLSEPQVIVVYKTVPFCGYNDEIGNEKKEIKWMKTENGNAEEVRMKYLKEYLEKCWKSIENIEIDDDKFMGSNLDLKHLPNLKNFENDTYDVREKGWLDWAKIKNLKSFKLTKPFFPLKRKLAVYTRFARNQKFISDVNFDLFQITKKNSNVVLKFF